VTFDLDGARDAGVTSGDAGIAGEEGVQRKGTALAVVVGAQDDEGVLDGDDDGQGPDDDRQRADQVLPAGLAGEGRRVYVEGGCSDVAVDGADALEAEPGEHEAAVGLSEAMSVPDCRLGWQA